MSKLNWRESTFSVEPLLDADGDGIKYRVADTYQGVKVLWLIESTNERSKSKIFNSYESAQG